MKNLFNRSVILLVVAAMTSITALAMTASRQVTFSKDVTVNGAPVKAGTYKATFNDETGEFKLMRGKNVVANATARREKVAGNFRGAYSLKDNGMTAALVSIDMGSNNQAVIVNSGADMKLVMP